MKNLMDKTSLILTMLLVFLFNSCNEEKFFELERPPQFPWQNVNELEYVAVAPYEEYFHDTWAGPHSQTLTFQVMQSDYWRWIGNVETYATEQIYYRQYNQRVGDIQQTFTKGYKIIGICNSGLDFFKEKEDEPFDVISPTSQTKNVLRIKGELLFMRAYCYYILVQTYCPPYDEATANEAILPLRDHLSLGSDDALNNTPVPTSLIYDLMIADLKEAKELLPEGYDNDMHVSYKSRARATKYAASALLSRIYFMMRRFTGNESALSELDFVINNGGFSLEPDPFTNFNNDDPYPDNDEVIWWSYYADPIKWPTAHAAKRLGHFNKNSSTAINGGRGTGTDWSQMVWFQMVPAKTALKKMDWMADPVNGDYTETDAARFDKRYQSLFYRYEGADPNAPSPEGLRSNASDDGKYLKLTNYYPLIGTNEAFVILDKFHRSPAGAQQNIPVIRLAELYLTRAIIKKRENQAGWAADYNMVARRAWDEDAAGVAYVDKTDAEVSEEMIHIERWKELAGEDEWYLQYLFALKMPLGLGDRSQGQVISYPYEGVGWEGSIPITEIDFRD